MASIIGGAIPVPGGAGVIKAGLIAGLTAAGVPQDQAVAAVFIQRLHRLPAADLGMGDAGLDAAPGVRVIPGEAGKSATRRVGWLERQVRRADRFQQR